MAAGRWLEEHARATATFVFPTKFLSSRSWNFLQIFTINNYTYNNIKMIKYLLLVLCIFIIIAFIYVEHFDISSILVARSNCYDYAGSSLKQI